MVACRINNKIEEFFGEIIMTGIGLRPVDLFFVPQRVILLEFYRKDGIMHYKSVDIDGELITTYIGGNSFLRPALSSIKQIFGIITQDELAAYAVVVDLSCYVLAAKDDKADLERMINEIWQYGNYETGFHWITRFL